MLELESYLVQHSLPGTVAPVQVDPVDQRSGKLMEMMAQLLTRLEMRGQREQNSGGTPKRQIQQVLCLMIKKLLCAIGVDKRAILHEAVHNQGRSLQIRGKLVSLGEDTLPPRESVRANTCTFNSMISIVNPSSSFTVTATINNVSVTFLLDTGSALTILNKIVWDKCKQPGDHLEPWNQQSLVGAEGTTLRVYGSACVQWKVDGMVFSHSVIVVVDPLTTEAGFLKGCMIDLVSHKVNTSDGQVIILNFQENNRKMPVLFVNVRLPAHSEMEILTDVSDFVHENQMYILEGVKL